MDRGAGGGAGTVSIGAGRDVMKRNLACHAILRNTHLYDF